MANFFEGGAIFGEAGETVTADFALKLGKILGARRKGTKCRAVIGKDARLSSYMLEHALVAGLISSGADAYIMHVTTAPSVSYIAGCDGFDFGIVVSGGPEPFYKNGIKVVDGFGKPLGGEELNYIRTAFSDGKFNYATGEEIGVTVDYVSGRNRYIAHLISIPEVSFKGLEVGLDCANGSAWQIAKSVFQALGARVHTIGDTPDGTNINCGCGAMFSERLEELVNKNSLDVGFAFDGSGEICKTVLPEKSKLRNLSDFACGDGMVTALKISEAIVNNF